MIPIPAVPGPVAAPVPLPLPTPARTVRLPEGDVTVFDGLLDPIGAVGASRVVQTAGLRRRASFNDDLNATLPVDAFLAAQPALAATFDAVVAAAGRGAEVALSHVIANAMGPGGRAVAHTDQDCPRCTTALLFAVPAWRAAWGGELILLDGDDAVGCIAPRPGRAVVFPSAVRHRGGVPQRDCPAFRLTLVAFYNCAEHSLRDVPGYGRPR